MEGVFKSDKLSDYTLRVAKVEDANRINEIFMDTAKWLQSKGSTQWSHYLKGEEIEGIKRDISNRTLYIIEDGIEVVATFNLSPEQNEWDKELWGKLDDHAYYIHRFSVNRKYKNQNMGRKLIDWVFENIKERDGYIRLDCLANNSFLNQLYQDAGFSFVGSSVMGESKFSKYEKAI